MHGKDHLSQIIHNNITHGPADIKNYQYVLRIEPPIQEKFATINTTTISDHDLSDENCDFMKDSLFADPNEMQNDQNDQTCPPAPPPQILNRVNFQNLVFHLMLLVLHLSIPDPSNLVNSIHYFLHFAHVMGTTI